MRYLAIIQVKPDGSFEQIIVSDDGNYAVENWKIKAEMNSSKPANIQVRNNDNSASLVSDGMLTFKEKNYKGREIGSSKLIEIIEGKEVFQEVTDQIPAAIQKVMERDK